MRFSWFLEYGTGIGREWFIRDYSWFWRLVGIDGLARCSFQNRDRQRGCRLLSQVLVNRPTSDRETQHSEH